MNMPDDHTKWTRRRSRLHEIIFEADTPAGKLYDVSLIAAIAVSVSVVMLDSVSSIRAAHGRTLYSIEWFFTILFSVEYIVRLLCVKRPTRYAFSFFGIVDLLGVIPTYLSLFGARQSLPGGHTFPEGSQDVSRTQAVVLREGIADTVPGVEGESPEDYGVPLYGSDACCGSGFYDVHD